MPNNDKELDDLLNQLIAYGGQANSGAIQAAGMAMAAQGAQELFAPIKANTFKIRTVTRHPDGTITFDERPEPYYAPDEDEEEPVEENTNPLYGSW